MAEPRFIEGEFGGEIMWPATTPDALREALDAAFGDASSALEHDLRQQRWLARDNAWTAANRLDADLERALMEPEP